LPYNDPSF